MSVKRTFGRARGPWRPKTAFNSSPRSTPFRPTAEFFHNTLLGRQNDVDWYMASDVWGITSPGPTYQPESTEYQFGTHDAAIKGSKAAGYGLTFGASVVFAGIAMLQHHGAFASTTPQVPVYQPSSINAPCPALYAAGVTPSLQKTVQTFPQDVQQQQLSTVFTLTAADGLQIPPLHVSIQTTPQIPLDQPSSVNDPCPALYVAVVTTPPNRTVQTFPQEIQQQAPSSVWGVTIPGPTYAPQGSEYQFGSHDAAIKGSYAAGYGVVFGTTVFQPAPATFPTGKFIGTQAELPIDGNSYVATFAVKNPDIPTIEPVQTWPQENLQIPPSSVFGHFPYPPNVAPPLRSAIVTQAEQPLPAPSMVVVTTAYTPSFVAGIPPLTTWVQSWPQEPATVDVNYSFVQTPTAANIPSVAPPPPPTDQGFGGSGGGGLGTFEFKKKPKRGPDAAELAEVALGQPVQAHTEIGDPDPAQIAKALDDDDDEAMMLLLL